MTYLKSYFPSCLEISGLDFWTSVLLSNALSPGFDFVSPPLPCEMLIQRSESFRGVHKSLSYS